MSYCSLLGSSWQRHCLRRCSSMVLDASSTLRVRLRVRDAQHEDAVRRGGGSEKRDAQPDPPARADRARRTAAVGAYHKATTGLVSSMRGEDPTWAEEPLPSCTLEGEDSDPAPEPPPPPSGEDWDRPLCRLAPRRSHSPRPPLALVRNTSRKCSVCLGESTLTSSTRRCQLCSARSPLASFPRPPAGSRAAQRRTASRDTIKMAELLRSTYAKRLVNQHQVILRSKVLRMHQWGISLPGACEGSFVAGAAPPTTRSSRWSRPTWDLVNMFGNC